VRRPGGSLLATTHGDFCARVFLKNESLKTYEQNGYCYLRTKAPESTFPDWYQSTFLNADYVHRIFGSLFETVVHVPRGLCDWQDAVILRRD
jgi:hypothetical protein